jgi:hypothetical protein
MGRGLSDLQRWMLQELGKEGYLPYCMIHERYFGWRRSRHYRGSIAPDEYNRVNATISRSARRLAKRGLVIVDHGCLLPLERSTRLAAELEALESRIAGLSVKKFN